MKMMSMGWMCLDRRPLTATSAHAESHPLIANREPVLAWLPANPTFLTSELAEREHQKKIRKMTIT